MKVGFGFKKSYYLKRVSIFLIMVALIVGIGGCDSYCTRDLTISSTAGGSVITPGQGTFVYKEGATVNLVAKANKGYHFVKWIGDVATIADVNAAITTITMSSSCSLIAKFEAIPSIRYYLTINSTAGGSVTTPGEETFLYYEGFAVELVATPDAGHRFTEWTGDVGTIAEPNSATTVIAMNYHYSITANFAPFAGGDGTTEDPFEIVDWYHLDNVRHYLGCHFILMNNLDINSTGYIELASTAANEGKGWQPIGTTVEGAKFASNFDGQGYEICNLFIDRPNELDVGLFGVIGETGFVENIGIVNGNVTGQDDVGVLVGKNEGIVKNCSSIGDVTGNNYVGILAGKNEGAVNSSYSTGSITGNMRVGGLVGQNSAKVNNSYSTSNVTGNGYVGGLTGKNEDVINNSYSTGSVTGANYVGGLIGKNDEGNINNSFWDTQTSGQATSDGGTGKTTAEMMEFDTFDGVEWDIFAVNDADDRNTDYFWNIVGDATYPFLSWQD